MQKTVDSTRIGTRHFELKAVVHGGRLHRLGLQDAQGWRSFGLEVGVTHDNQQPLLTSTLPVCGGGDRSDIVQQRGLSLQLCDLGPQVLDGLFKLLDDVDVFLLQLHRGLETFLLQREGGGRGGGGVNRNQTKQAVTGPDQRYWNKNSCNLN